jgi:site-specific recombinase XerD
LGRRPAPRRGAGTGFDDRAPARTSWNAFVGHLEARAFAAPTVRAYAYDLLNFARFATERGLVLADVVPTDVTREIGLLVEAREDAVAEATRVRNRLLQFW